jgi:hypothetical protein
MANETSVSEKVQSFYLELSTAAERLNQVSDEFGRTISVLDDALEQLNLGVSAWVPITSGGDERGDYYWSRDIGYAKPGKRWGIALRTVSGYESAPDEETEESWLFNEAPRWLRIEAVAKIPELLQKLTKQADETSTRIQKKTVEAKELAAAIKAAAAASRSTRK